MCVDGSCVGFGVERSHFVIRCWPFVLRSVKTYTLGKIVIDSVPMRILPQLVAMVPLCGCDFVFNWTSGTIDTLLHFPTSSCTAMVGKGIQKGLKEWNSERGSYWQRSRAMLTHTHPHTQELLLLHAEVISEGVICVHGDLTFKVRPLWCYFQRQVLKHGFKDTHFHITFSEG